MLRIRISYLSAVTAFLVAVTLACVLFESNHVLLLNIGDKYPCTVFSAVLAVLCLGTTVAVAIIKENQ